MLARLSILKDGLLLQVSRRPLSSIPSQKLELILAIKIEVAFAHGHFHGILLDLSKNEESQRRRTHQTIKP